MGTIFVQYALGLNLFITSRGGTKNAMFSILIGAIANIVLDPIFIFDFSLAWAFGTHLYFRRGVAGFSWTYSADLHEWNVAVRISVQIFFAGTGQAKKSLFNALLRKMIILIPLAIALSNLFGVMGIFYAEPIADVTSATTSGILLHLTMKKLLKDDLLCG